MKITELGAILLVGGIVLTYLLAVAIPDTIRVIKDWWRKWNDD